MAKNDNFSIAQKTITFAMLNIIVVNNIELNEQEKTEDVLKVKENIYKCLVRMNSYLVSKNYEKVKEEALLEKKEYIEYKEFFENKLTTIKSRTFEDFVMVLDRVLKILDVLLSY